MSAIFDKIRACLDNRLINTPSVPAIAHDNVVYDTVVGTPFVKVTFNPLSARPATRGLNPQIRYGGTYQILICVPEGFGTGDGLKIADSLMDSFAATTDISYNGIIVTVDYAEINKGFLDSPFYCIPLTVAWYIYN